LDSSSQENIAKLRDLCKNDIRKVAVFAGAGVSKGPGLPDWDGLLQLLCHHLSSGGPTLSDAQKKAAWQAFELEMALWPIEFRQQKAAYELQQRLLHNSKKSLRK